jgi:predicted nuclease of predicted toxin-antitoxin system
MNLLADESVDKPIVDRLRQDGHRVLYIAELEPGINDETVLQQANQDNALLLTADKDFGELVFRQGRVHAGVVLIRLSGLSLPAKASAVSSVFKAHSGELVNAFSVISPGNVRIRHTQRPSDNT